MENLAFDVAALLAPPDILKSKCALCIQPHPDDNEIGMGGTVSVLPVRLFILFTILQNVSGLAV